jgi:hypothetical protein
MESFTMFYFNGTGVQLQSSREDMEAHSAEFAREGLKHRSLPELKKEVLAKMTEMEEDINTQFADREYNLRNLYKYWGKDALTNYLRWFSWGIFLLKTKMIQNDNKNGWACWDMTIQHALSLEGGPLKRVDLTKGLHKCSYCGMTGIIKKCSGCNEAYYCDAECQRNGWATHKPICRKLNQSIQGKEDI